MTAPRPRRVLHIARRYAPMVGGIERYVIDVAEAQARRGDRVRVVTLQVDVLGVHDEPLPASERLAGVDVTRLPGFGNQRFSVCLRPDRMARAIRSADVVHIHDLRFMLGFVAIVARMTGRPLVFHTHGLLAHTTFASGLKRILMRWYYGPMLRLGRAIVAASSEHDAEMLLADVPALGPRTRVLLNAVALDPYLAVSPAPVPGRILVIGRVAERKGIDRLVRALARLRSRGTGPAWSLLIAGTEDTQERQRLDALLAEHSLVDDVRFHGGYTESEHLTLLASADVAVFPSRAEGFGLALLEAMAAGCVLLASDIPPHRALLEEGAPASLVAFDDPDGSADALATALTLDATERERRSAAVRAATAAYDIERLIDDIEGVYTTVGVRPAR